nr:aminotransferase class III-fold pyridoxal phosphate-dependent enzyme [Chitinivibrio alkaliphilus]
MVSQRRETENAGALLIFDEVISGFRVAPGGAQELFSLKPDLTCLGKIMGGGLPAAAFGGRADIMEYLAPQGSVYQAGTLSGNPLAVAAGTAVLSWLDSHRHIYDELETKTAAAVCEMQKKAPAYVSRCGSAFTLFHCTHTVENAAQARKQDRESFSRFWNHCRSRGVFLPPSPFETAFISTAHTDADMETLIQCVDEFSWNL